MGDTDDTAEIETVMRTELRRGDHVLVSRAGVLRQLLAGDDRSMFTDAVLARVRAMAGDLACQLAVRMAEAGGETQAEAWMANLGEPIAGALIDEPEILAHLHSLALEWQLTEALQRRAALDPVLSPLLQAQIAADDPTGSELAAELLAAQAAFVRRQQAMGLALEELPPAVLDLVLGVLRAAVRGDAAAEDRARGCEQAVRGDYDADRCRTAIADRLARSLGSGAFAALCVTHAGVALFLSVLAEASGDSRDVAAAATSESQLARLALSLRAAGMSDREAAREFLTIHPDITLPEALGSLDGDTARALLTRPGALTDGRG